MPEEQPVYVTPEPTTLMPLIGKRMFTNMHFAIAAIFVKKTGHKEAGKRIYFSDILEVGCFTGCKRVVINGLKTFGKEGFAHAKRCLLDVSFVDNSKEMKHIHR